MCKRNVSLAAALVAAGLSQSAFAVPYAAQFTQTTPGTINYVLSEAADNVYIVRDGVSTLVGPLAMGAQSFTLDGAANFQVIAEKADVNGFLKVNNTFNAAGTTTAPGTGFSGTNAVARQIGDTTTAGTRAQRFAIPRDVAINTNAATPGLFGRTYVLHPYSANTAAGTPGGGARPTGEGIYILNADRSYFDPLNPDVALKGVGATFDGSATNQADLFKVALDEDGNLYVSDFAGNSTIATGTPPVTNPNPAGFATDSPLSRGVRFFNPDVTVSSDLLNGQFGKGFGITANDTAPVGPTLNHGAVGGLIVTGSASAGNLKLFTLDQNLAQVNGLYTYNLGSTTVGFSDQPTLNANASPIINFARPIRTDAELGYGGRLYLSQYRSDGADSGLYIVAPDASRVVYSSLTDSRLLGIDGNTAPTVTGTQDVFRLVNGFDISPDGKTLAYTTDSAGATFVMPVIEGIPDIANRSLITNPAGVTAATGTFTGSSGTDTEFDAAGNLYITNRSNERVIALTPGGVSRTIYSSNGGLTTGSFKTVVGAAFDGSGSYDDNTKWLLAVVPGKDPVSLEDFATVGALSTGPQTLSIDTDVNLSKLTFAGGDYTVGGTAKIVTGGDGSFESFLEGRIIAESGNQTINALVDVRKSFGVGAYTGSTLTLNNVTFANAAKTDPASTPATPLPLVSNVGQLTIQKFGGGTVAMPAFQQKLLVVRDGTLKFNSTAAAGAARVTALSIAGTAAVPTATLDLASTGLVLDYTLAATTPPPASPYANYVSLIKSGRAGGAWTGKGITSSLAATDSRYAVGIVEGSDVIALFETAPMSGIGTFMGAAFDGTSLLLRTTLKGDTNLSATVDFDDLLSLAQNYGAQDPTIDPPVAGTKTWFNGDFDYSGYVDFDDLLSLAQNYGGTALTSGDVAAFSSASFAADWALAQSLVPEPTSLTLLGLGAVAMRRRRSR